MAAGCRGYLQATRRPWFCVLFVLPLLLLYEAGLYLLSTSDPNLLRNGADVWLRSALASLGLPHLLWAPGLILVILLLWSVVCSSSAPHDGLSIWIGMAVESVAFAVILYGLGTGLGAALARLHPPLREDASWLLANAAAPPPALARLVIFLGAGIYEETLFRLLLLSSLYWVFQQADLPWPGAWFLAALSSALFFAAAHHFGPHGESFNSLAFSFRTLAGMYFALLFHYRGFGVAVGAHTGYDVLVGVVL